METNNRINTAMGKKHKTERERWAEYIMKLMVEAIPIVVMDECIRNLSEGFYAIALLVFMTEIICFYAVCVWKDKSNEQKEQLIQAELSSEPGSLSSQLFRYEKGKKEKHLKKYETMKHYIMGLGIVSILLFFLLKFLLT